jgi:hypothetical protein
LATSVTSVSGVCCCRRRGRQRRLQKPMRSFALGLSGLCQVLHGEYATDSEEEAKAGICKGVEQESRSRGPDAVAQTTVSLKTGVCACAAAPRPLTPCIGPTFEYAPGPDKNNAEPTPNAVATKPIAQGAFALRFNIGGESHHIATPTEAAHLGPVFEYAHRELRSTGRDQAGADVCADC